MASRPIDKLVYSTTPPQNTNVAWLDVSNRTDPTIKIFSAGDWRITTGKTIDLDRLTPEEVIELLDL